MWNWIIPILTLIAGAAAGFALGVFYVQRKLSNMQSDPEMLARMAKQMGYNLNKQQMNKVQSMMKNKRMR